MKRRLVASDGCSRSRRLGVAARIAALIAASPAQAADASRIDDTSLRFLPWTKFCLLGRDVDAKPVCFTGREGRTEAGAPAVAAVLIEPDSEPKKILRVTLPLGMSIQPGTRVIVDSGEPMAAPYVICFNNGCMADYDASADLISRLKQGQGLVVQGIDGSNQPVSTVVPLAGFAAAYDGLPTDPKEYEAQQRAFQEGVSGRNSLSHSPARDDRIRWPEVERHQKLRERIIREPLKQ